MNLKTHHTFTVGIDTLELKRFGSFDHAYLSSLLKTPKAKPIPQNKLRPGQYGVVVDGIGYRASLDRCKVQVVTVVFNLQRSSSSEVADVLEMVTGRSLDEIADEFTIPRLDIYADTETPYRDIASRVSVKFKQQVVVHRRGSIRYGGNYDSTTIYDKLAQHGEVGTRIERRLRWKSHAMLFRSLPELLTKAHFADPFSNLRIYDIGGLDAAKRDDALLLSYVRETGSVQAAIRRLDSAYVEHKYARRLLDAGTRTVDLLPAFQDWLYAWRLDFFANRHLPIPRRRSVVEGA